MELTSLREEDQQTQKGYVTIDKMPKILKADQIMNIEYLQSKSVLTKWEQYLNGLSVPKLRRLLYQTPNYLPPKSMLKKNLMDKAAREMMIFDKREFDQITALCKHSDWIGSLKHASHRYRFFGIGGMFWFVNTI